MFEPIYQVEKVANWSGKASNPKSFTVTFAGVNLSATSYSDLSSASICAFTFYILSAKSTPVSSGYTILGSAV